MGGITEWGVLINDRAVTDVLCNICSTPSYLHHCHCLIVWDKPFRARGVCYYLAYSSLSA